MEYPIVAFDFFYVYQFDLGKIEKKIDMLIEIAMSTNNGEFDDWEQRSDLYLFKYRLMDVLSHACQQAKSKHKEFLERVSATRKPPENTK